MNLLDLDDSCRPICYETWHSHFDLLTVLLDSWGWKVTEETEVSAKQMFTYLLDSQAQLQDDLNRILYIYKKYGYFTLIWKGATPNGFDLDVQFNEPAIEIGLMKEDDVAFSLLSSNLEFSYRSLKGAPHPAWLQLQLRLPNVLHLVRTPSGESAYADVLPQISPGFSIGERVQFSARVEDMLRDIGVPEDLYLVEDNMIVTRLAVKSV